MKKLVTLLVIMLAAAVLFSPVSPNNAMAAQKDWPKGLTVGTAPMGSTYFILLSGWADLISKHLKISSAAESTGGPAANVVLIEKGQVDLAAATNLVLYQGWHGKAWAKGVEYQKVRAILPLYPGTFHLYAPADRGIKSIYDLEGKRVCVGGSGTTPGILGPMVWEILGINVAKKVNLGWSDANSAIRDGLIDAVQGLMGIPFPSCLELMSTHDVIISSIPEKDIPKLIEELPLLGRTVIPANTYKGQTSDIPTIDVWGYMLAGKDMAADLVYEICKQTMENHNELLQVHKSAKHIKDLKAIANSVVPVHTGALKYYKEIGISVPDKLVPPEAK
jgi:hypothetical protein